MRRFPQRSSFAIVMLGLIINAGCLTGGPKKFNGPATDLRYFLPKTVIAVDVQVEHSSQSPGKYCDLLDLFFPDLDSAADCQVPEKKTDQKTPPQPGPGERMVAAKQKTSIQGYSIALKGTPDPDRAHVVAFESSWHVERADSMNFTEDGTLTGAEIQRTDRTAEIVFGVLSNVAKIAGRFAFGGVDAKAIELAQEEAKKRKQKPAPWETDMRLKPNFDLMTAARKAQYVKYWNGGEGDGATRLSLAMRSYEHVLEDLDHLQTVQLGATTGAQAVLPDLRKQIDDRLVSDFVGSKSKDVWTPSYELTPKAPAATGTETITLFKFAGCGVTAEAERPVKNTLSALRCADLLGAKESTLTFTVNTASGKQASRLSTPDPTPSASAESILFYVRPEPVTLNLTGNCTSSVLLRAGATADDDPILEKQSDTPCALRETPSLLAQWGTQGEIPKAGQDFSYNVALYEATGAVKSLKLTSKAALDSATIDKAFGIPTTLLDAKDAADAAKKKKTDEEAAAVDELNVLTRRRQILEEQAKIKKLCEEIGATSCEL